MDEDAVLVGERREIGDGADGDEIDERARIGQRGAAGVAQARAQRGGEVEGDADGGEPLEREAAARLVRVDERERVGIALGHLVVIDDDDVDAAGARDGERVVIAGAAVAGDDDGAAGVGEARGVVDCRSRSRRRGGRRARRRGRRRRRGTTRAARSW